MASTIRLRPRETRASLDRFTVEQLQAIHLDLFGKPSGDSISRRLALKLFRELVRRYADEDAGQLTLAVDPTPDAPFTLPTYPCLTCGGTHAHKCCPRCHATVGDNLDDIVTVFGLRRMGDKVRTQSQCRKCRAAAARSKR